MTISSDAVRKAGPFVGNSIVTVFAFAFKTFSASDLSVTLLTTATSVQQLLVLNTDYTVQLNANQNTNPGGTVTTIGAISPIPNTQTLTISGNAMADTQGTDLITPGPWVPDDVENMVDRAMIAAQQLRDRAIKFPVIDSVAPIDLPPAETRKNTTLIFDGNGQITVGAVSTVTVPTVTGGVLFGAGAGVAQDATKLFWDNTNKRLGIGNNGPSFPLDVTGSGRFSTSVQAPLITTAGAGVDLGLSTANGAQVWTIRDDTKNFVPKNSDANDIGDATHRVGKLVTSIVDTGTTTSLRARTNLGTIGLEVADKVGGSDRWILVQGNTGSNASFRTGGAAGGIDMDASGMRFTTIGTTGSAANAFLDNANANNILRSTSSARYKTVLRDFDVEAARALITKAKPVVYESKSMADYAGEEYVGFLAEDIAEIDSRFATYDVQGRPDWVQYPTFVVPLTLIAADHERRLAALEARIQ